MSGDKFSAVWVSHTSLSDFTACPRAYFLKHIYRDAVTGHKVKLMSPSLALGQSVHEVLESLSVLPLDKRFSESLIEKFDRVWTDISGRKGGYLSSDVENEYKNRGKEMIKRVMNHPGPIAKLAVKIKMDLPYFWLSEEENIILCGKIDWLEYYPDMDGVNIIDFKTGKGFENSESLQLPIYNLLVMNCQPRKICRASYWYLGQSDEPVEVSLPDIEESRGKVLRMARSVRVARKLERFKCEHEGGCMYCKPMESIIRGEAEFVGADSFNQDVYILEQDANKMPDSEIL